MKAKGKTILRIAGALELIFGIAMLAMLLYITRANTNTSIQIFGTHPTSMTFYQLAITWIQCGFAILAGLAGVLFASFAKTYKLCTFFGYGMLVIAILNSLGTDFNIQAAMKELYAYIVPLLYLWGAAKNKRSVH